MGDNLVTVRVEVNGEDRTLELPARTTLADALRDHLGLTGTHLGCEHGVCGSCTVLLDDRSARSCITLAAQVDGRRVTTIEGLSVGGELSPLQCSFAEHGGLQCGFCTPGFVVAATELLRDIPAPDEPTIRSALSGNTCRCTGYEAIVDAVLAQADATRESRSPAWPDQGPPPGATGAEAPPPPRSQTQPAPLPGLRATVDDSEPPVADRRQRSVRWAAGLALIAGGLGIRAWLRARRSPR